MVDSDLFESELYFLSSSEGPTELEITTLDEHHAIHCRHCFNSRQCQFNIYCPLVFCPNKCGQVYHECKRDEHLEETCAEAFVDCANKENGCKLKIKRKLLGAHLYSCVASVIRCGSYTMRRVYNKHTSTLKWPDPIQIQADQIKSESSKKFDPIYICDYINLMFICFSCEQVKSNLNDQLIENDYESLSQFASNNPLMFQRMYGYLIGLKLESFSRKNEKFGFLRYLLKNVKSKIFKDLEAENCIVYNDYEGCAACQVRIRNMEIERFNKLRLDYFNFGILLKFIYSYEDFVQEKVYENPEFLEVYHKKYPMPEDVILDEQQEALSDVDKRDLDEKLKKNNEELLECMRMDDKILKLNTNKELACDAFQLDYESYRIVETNFSVDCDKFLRRDEYSEHYSLVHNFLMPYMDFTFTSCPYREYGCKEFEQKYDFLFVKDLNEQSAGGYESWSEHPLAADLVYNKTCASLCFNLKNETKSNQDNRPVSLLDLPYDVLWEICQHLDSISLFNLSLTSKVSFKMS